MAARPILNQLRGDRTFGQVLGYDISVLTFWSAAFLCLCVMRLARKPSLDSHITICTASFLLYIALIGIPRTYINSAIIKDFLFLAQFMIAMLVSPKIISDLSTDYILNRLYIGGVVLISMHLTAPVWASSFTMEPEFGNFIGAFDSKHMAAPTFLAVLPFVLLYHMRKRDTLSLIVLSAIVAALAFSFQRTSLLSLLIMTTVLLFLSRNLRLILPILGGAAIFSMFGPGESLNKFLEIKFIAEYDAYKIGSIDAVGAGRLGIFLLGLQWFVNSFDIIQQAFGLGMAHSYKLHSIVGGSISYAHIQIIQVLIDYGFFGLLGLLWIFCSVFVKRKNQLALQRDWFNIVAMSVVLGIFCEMFYAMPLMHGGTATLFAFWFLSTEKKAEPPRMTSGGAPRC
jgi:hypothetical protein